MRMIYKWLCDIFDMEETSFREDLLKYIQDHPEKKKELQEKLGVDEDQLIEEMEKILRSIWPYIRT